MTTMADVSFDDFDWLFDFRFDGIENDDLFWGSFWPDFSASNDPYFDRAAFGCDVLLTLRLS